MGEFTDWVHYFIKNAVGPKVSDALITKSYPQVRVHTYAVGGDTTAAVVVLEQSIDELGWEIMATITNPTTSGEMYVLDNAPYTRARIVSFVPAAGETINVVLEQVQ